MATSGTVVARKDIINAKVLLFVHKDPGVLGWYRATGANSTGPLLQESS